MTPPGKRVLFSGLLVLLALNAAVFWPVLRFELVRWDDDINITENPLLREPWSGSLVAHFFSGEQALRFKPFHWLLARGVHEAAGLNPAAWHAFNLGLHLGATVLFYLVLRQVMERLIRHPSSGLSLNHELAALMGAALWSMHPLRAESVGWATASTYPLSAVCLLASFACYLRAHEPVAHRGWMVGAWSLAVLAYASYPVTITYGVWLMIVDLWLLPRFAPANSTPKPNWRKFALKHACFLLPAAIAVGITVWSRFSTPGIFTTAPSVESVGIVARAAMALATLTALVGRLFWPVNLTPNVPPLPSGALTPAIIGLAAVAAVALFGAWRIRRSHPMAMVTVWGFAALSIPCLGLTERPNWPVDRYSYIAHLALVGAVTVGLTYLRMSNAGKITASILGIGLIGGLATATQTQSLIWSDTRTLFAHMESHPGFTVNPRQQGHIYLLWANEEKARSNPARAGELLEQAQQTYLKAIQRAVAAANYPEALSLSTHVERHFGLTPTFRRERGAWLLRENRIQEALNELQTAASALPDDQRLRTLLAEATARAGP